MWKKCANFENVDSGRSGKFLFYAQIAIYTPGTISQQKEFRRPLRQ